MNWTNTQIIKHHSKRNILIRMERTSNQSLFSQFKSNNMDSQTIKQPQLATWQKIQTATKYNLIPSFWTETIKNRNAIARSTVKHQITSQFIKPNWMETDTHLQHFITTTECAATKWQREKRIIARNTRSINE